MNIVDLLKDKLIDKNLNEFASIKNIKEDECVLAFYFAATWCEPCLAFTQLLISFYEDMAIKYDKKKCTKENKRFEVIFVSSDFNEEDFRENIKEMPWPSVAYKHCQLRKKISKKYNVKEIPCLVLLEGWSGKTINTKGRDSLLEDINGDNFPWRRPSLMDVLGTQLIVAGQLKDCSDLLRDVHIGIYFSAFWCPPCRLLTTHLIEVYNQLKQSSSQKKFEVVFVSSDRSVESFNDYSSGMPWLLLPFQDPRTKAITKHFDVQGIPTLILLNPDHEVISSNARSAVFNDPIGEHFPWSCEQPEELSESSIEVLHHSPCLVFFTEGRKELIEKARTVLTKATNAYHEQRRISRDYAAPLPHLNVFYEGAQSDEVADSVRAFAQIDGREPLVAIIEEGRVLRGADNQLEPPEIEALIERFKTDWLDGEDEG